MTPPSNNDHSRKGNVTIDGEYAVITFKRLLHHSPQRVWDAITNPADLKEWLMCSFAMNDEKAGGTVEMVSGPAQFHTKGKILTWEPPRVYEHEWNVAAVPEMPNGENAVFRYELVPQGSDTLLTVTYRRLTQRTALGFAPGTHVLLDRLEAQLDGKALPGWMPRFQELMALYPAWKK